MAACAINSGGELGCPLLPLDDAILPDDASRRVSWSLRLRVSKLRQGLANFGRNHAPLHITVPKFSVCPTSPRPEATTVGNGRSVKVATRNLNNSASSKLIAKHVKYLLRVLQPADKRHIHAYLVLNHSGNCPRFRVVMSELRFCKHASAYSIPHGTYSLKCLQVYGRASLAYREHTMTEHI